jgi:hypothetical protein
MRPAPKPTIHAHYLIEPSEYPGRVNVSLYRVTVYPIDDGFKEYDIDGFKLTGIVPFDGMEEDIRLRFDSWLKTAEEEGIPIEM